MPPFSRAEAFLASLCRVSSRLLRKRKEDGIMARPLHASDNLARLYRDQSRYQEAESLYQRAIAIDEKAFGPEHAEVATDLEAYAILLRAMNRPEEALALEERARAIRDKSDSQ